MENHFSGDEGKINSCHILNYLNSVRPETSFLVIMSPLCDSQRFLIGVICCALAAWS